MDSFKSFIAGLVIFSISLSTLLFRAYYEPPMGWNNPLLIVVNLLNFITSLGGALIMYYSTHYSEGDL